jgi:hypothetical protein
MKRLWFKNKTYGYGWVPVTWEGWVAMLVYAIGMIFIVRNILALVEYDRFRGVWVAISMGRIALLTLALLIVARWKGEKPGWHWGKRD